jgi:hypothetical protein
MPRDFPVRRPVFIEEDAANDARIAAKNRLNQQTQTFTARESGGGRNYIQ